MDLRMASASTQARMDTNILGNIQMIKSTVWDLKNIQLAANMKENFKMTRKMEEAFTLFKIMMSMRATTSMG